MLHLFRYAPDDLAGGGTGATPAAEAGQATGATPAQGDNATPGATPSAVEFEAWLATQSAEVQAAYKAHTSKLEGALKAERDEKKALASEKKAREQAQADAERKRLESEGKFKELADQATARLAEVEQQVAELPTLKERVTRYEAALKGYAEQARKGLPKHVLALLDEKDPVDQLEYLAKFGDDLRKPSGPGGPTGSPGLHATPDLSDEQRRAMSFRRTSL